MAVVLGIDAAWTLGNPSGVALVARAGSTWRLIRASSSYQGFLGGPPHVRPTGGRAPVGELLAHSVSLASDSVTLVAVDMPLARDPIVGRRTSDDAVSRAFGAMKCAVHSPSALRPGAVSDDFTAEFACAGYDLVTDGAFGVAGVIEVYPHPALVRLCAANERLRYKYGKLRGYWRDLDREACLAALRGVWAQIVAALEPEVAGAAEHLTIPPPGSPTWMMKAFEDTLDAVVCAWVGICALEGRAEPFGDGASAIWVPIPRERGA